MRYKKVNDLLGWLCFAIAAVTYISTLERSVSFWDCGEFISCAFRLQISHQPGYPLFAMIGKAFSLLSMGDNTKVPFFTNMGSALASATAIMLLFWIITAMAKKLLVKRGEEADQPQTILIMGSGLVGALAFTFTDTFWFSAVETIVFAWSSLCTALVIWGIMKWDAHSDEPGADRWIVFIAYVIGLSIGIHLLNLLTIPAIALVYYFRRYSNITTKSTIIALLCGVLVLGLIQFGLIQYTVKFAAYFDLFFVNTLNMGFGSGAIFFLLILVAALVFGIRYSILKNKPTMNLAFLCIVFIYLGYSSFAMIIIRAKADPDLNNTAPDNAFTMLSYLNRDQYGDRPLLYGQYYDSEQLRMSPDSVADLKKSGTIVYRKGKTHYEEASTKYSIPMDRNTFFPRVYDQEGQHPQFYKQWLQIADGEHPQAIDNVKFLFSWQIWRMYARYFLWNFVGRYNDMDGQANQSLVDGQFTTGLFDSHYHVPQNTLDGNTYTPLFALPLIIGLFGAVYHFRKNKRDAIIVALLYFFMGLAIVLYLNQPPMQPRERDYSYVGSFYAFAIWIGLGVLGIAEIIGLAIKKLDMKVAGIIATGLCLLLAPVLMASKEWKAHDRSTKMTPHDMAYNYLNSCLPNAILFTYGDNDTYSLWYDQEVEGIRPDVRIVNLSLLGTDWYIRGMKHKINASDPLPIAMADSTFQLGVRDVIYYYDYKSKEPVELKTIYDILTSDKDENKMDFGQGDKENILPTKNFKMTINADDVIKNGVIPASQRDSIAKEMDWKYQSNYVTKDNLAMIDILAHNNWKRPVYFAITVGPENMMGLEKYLYKEGFAYHLMPFKTDTATKTQQAEKSNVLVEYDNIMNKFKWGNMKNAKYLDHESNTMFYPLIIKLFGNLAQNLVQQGHRDLAANVLKKYDEVMPDIYPEMEEAYIKNYIAQIAYDVGNTTLANKTLASVDKFLVDQLNYNAYLLQNNNGDGMSQQDVQGGLSTLNDMLMITEKYKQADLHKKYQAQFDDYKIKFSSLMGARQ